MQIIIAGSGEVGFALARALGRNHDVFVIDHDATAGERLQSVDAEFVLGSGTSAAVLRAHFGHLHPVSKILLTAAMWVGRLEVLPVLVLLRPELWRMSRW